MAVVQFDVLGPPDLRVGGTSVGVETRKAYAVLAYVVMEGPQRRDALDVLLWPDSDATRARAALRRTLSALRKVVPEGFLADGDDVALAGAVRTDLDEVDELLGPGEPTRDPQRLAAADALHRGDFLAGLHFGDADPFEHWRRDTAERFTRRHTAILERWCRVLIDRGDHPAATDVARRRLAMDPLHEPSHQQLMLLHAWQGDRGAAVRQYAECVRVLDEELGVAPLPRTTALDRAVRAGTIEPPPGRAEAAGAALAGPSGAGGTPTPAAAPSGVASVPFVGRDEELDRLAALHAGCRSDGALAVVRGEAGIGKTRLVRELAAQVPGRVVAVASQSGEEALAYAPVTAALRAVAGSITALDDGVRRELARLAPDVAGVRPPEDALTSPGARTRLVDACATALTAALAAGDGPGLLVVDDLDRADPETRELVAYLARRPAGRPLLVTVTCRDDRALALPTPDLQLDLGRLAVEEVATLAADQDVAIEEAVRLHAESEGVPYLVVSYLAARRAGATGWDLPRDGRQLVRSRLERLGEVARQALAAAAVLGSVPSPEVLGRVSGRADDELVTAVEELVAAGLLDEAEGDGSLGFTHDKVRAVVLEDTSQVRRRLLHRRAADALAVATPPVAAATLAHHLEAAGRQDEAAAAHVEAGRRATRLYANAEAVEHLEAALALGHPDAGDLLLEVGELLVRLGRYGQAGQRYTRAAAHGADPVLVEQRLGALALREGRDDAAEGHLRLALEAGPDGLVRVLVVADLARVLLRREDLVGAAEQAGAAVAAAADLDSPAATARARNVAGLVARRRDDLEAARRHLRASLAAAEDAEQRAAALNNLALVLGESGELDEALVVAREALEAGQAVADRHREAALLSNLADLLHAAGRTDEALELQGDAAERFAGVGEAPTATPEIWQLVDW